MKQYTIGDLTLTLPDTWQADPAALIEALFQYDNGSTLLAVHRFPIIEPDEDAAQGIMEQFIQNDYEEIAQHTGEIAGNPTQVVISRWQEPDGDDRFQQAAVIRRPHELVAIIGITDNADRDLSLFAEILDTISFQPEEFELPLPPLVPYHDEKLAIHLDVPIGWTAMATADFPLQIFAPSEADYRASFAVTLQELPDPSPDMLEELVDDYYIQGNNDLAGYQLIQSQTFTLDDQPGYSFHHEWQGEGRHFTELDTYIYRAPQHFYHLHGYTLKQLEMKYFPIFVHMLNSLHFDA